MKDGMKGWIQDGSKMGRTVLTYRAILEEAIRDWDGFRRALRKDDLLAFDGMMRKARTHASASGFNPMADTADTIFISILLEHEKELEELKRAGRAKVAEGSGQVEMADRDDRAKTADRDEWTMMAGRDDQAKTVDRDERAKTVDRNERKRGKT